jgi:hypothetical protein
MQEKIAACNQYQYREMGHPRSLVGLSREEKMPFQHNTQLSTWENQPSQPF